MTCSDSMECEGRRWAAERCREDWSSRRRNAATRPGRRSYVRNYRDVISPPLWRTLWITSCGGGQWGCAHPCGASFPPSHRPRRWTAATLCAPVRGIAARRWRGQGAPAARSLPPSPRLSAPAAQCSAPPASRTSVSVESATSTIRTSARAAERASTTSAEGTWTKPPRIPSSAGSVASRCCRA